MKLRPPRSTPTHPLVPHTTLFRCGWPVVAPPANTSDSPGKTSNAGAPTPATTAATPEISPAAMVINRPLRSGQRIYARNTDLIVIGVVSQGAEVIADGNIHVYGPLRGKAMAGARGDTSARIFTTQLDPELLAIVDRKSTRLNSSH